jgi:hypothetical protein
MKKVLSAHFIFLILLISCGRVMTPSVVLTPIVTDMANNTLAPDTYLSVTPYSTLRYIPDATDGSTTQPETISPTISQDLMESLLLKEYPRGVTRYSSFEQVTTFGGQYYLPILHDIVVDGGMIHVKSEPYNWDGINMVKAGQRVTATQNGKLLISVDCGSILDLNPIQATWVYQTHWILELYRNTNGYYHYEIFQDGISMNEIHRYDSSFGFQILGGKPFFFFKKNGKLGFSYQGREHLLNYDDIFYSSCYCEIRNSNPIQYENAVIFYALRNDSFSNYVNFPSDKVVQVVISSNN